MRGIYLGQDRYKRRYFILPNAGGIYVEGLDSGSFDEDICVKTKEEKEEQKEQIDSLLTSLKSPTIKTPASSSAVVDSTCALTTSVTSASNINMEKVTTTETSALVKPAVHIQPVSLTRSHATETNSTSFSDSNVTTSPVDLKQVNMSKPNIKWFSLGAKQRCEDSKPPATLSLTPLHKTSTIQPPDIKKLADDRRFLESVYASYSQCPLPGGSLMNSLTSHQLSGPSLLGLPPEIDINLLIQQDPQKAAELLEIQLVVPQEIPEEFRTGWWRITDPELISKINKCAHPRYYLFICLFQTKM